MKKKKCIYFYGFFVSEAILKIMCEELITFGNLFSFIWFPFLQTIGYNNNILLKKKKKNLFLFL